MKRKVAFKKHKNGCIICDKTLKKGDVYYTEKVIYKDPHDDSIVSFTIKRCARCVYEQSDSNKRFESFKYKCVHPKEFQNEVYSYMPFEAVKEPDYIQCMLCGKNITGGKYDDNKIIRNSQFTRLN